jgi:hypothetical protein
MDPWEVMPAPHGPIYHWRESGKTEWQCVLILGVPLGGKIIFLRTSAVTDALEQGDRAGIMGAKRPTGSGALRKGIRWTALFAWFRSYRI